MKHIVVALAVLMGCAVIATPAEKANSLTGKEKAEGWKLLFDGKSLDQWDLSTSLKAEWKAVDGTIVTDSKQGGTLLSKEDFANFELKVEFRTTDNVNSGVMLRNPRPDANKKGGGGQGYEVQIRDKDPGHYTGGSYLTGSLVNVEKVLRTSRSSWGMDVTRHYGGGRPFRYPLQRPKSGGCARYQAGERRHRIAVGTSGRRARNEGGVPQHQSEASEIGASIPRSIVGLRVGTKHHFCQTST